MRFITVSIILKNSMKVSLLLMSQIPKECFPLTILITDNTFTKRLSATKIRKELGYLIIKTHENHCDFRQDCSFQLQFHVHVL